MARIPGAPQIFNAILLTTTALIYPRRLRAMTEIEATVAQWPGLRVSLHRLGGVGFFVHGKESSHIHGNGLLDCFVGRAQRDALVREGRAERHHVFPNSGWISFWIRDDRDVRPALELIRIASGRPPGE